MKKIRILVIDDEAPNRRSMYECLSDLGEVTTAVNGANGLEVFRRSGNFDVVFTDRTMPGGVLGDDVVREIKRLSPKTFVVLMSGDEREEIKRVGLAAGADRVLFKPVRLEKIEEVIKVASGQ